MRISGMDLSSRKPEVVVIPFGSEEVAIWCYPVLNYDQFEAICPKPVPNFKQKMMPGGKTEPIPDATYADRLDEWYARRFHWLVITSLRDIEWDEVKLDDPTTWEKFHDELTSTFSGVEVGRIMATVTKVCGLSNDAIEKATDSFLALMAEKSQSE